MRECHHQLSPSLESNQIWSFPKSWGYPPVMVHFDAIFHDIKHPLGLRLTPSDKSRRSPRPLPSPLPDAPAGCGPPVRSPRSPAVETLNLYGATMVINCLNFGRPGFFVRYGQHLTSCGGWIWLKTDIRRPRLLNAMYFDLPILDF